MGNKLNAAKDLTFMQKIAYGVGDAGCNFCWSFIASFIMIYCTNTLGVSAAVIGTLMMVSKILDGVTDVFMGRIIDATRSKMGKARFWMFVSAFPCAIFTFLLFNIPAMFTENTKYVYFFIVYTLIGAVFYTMNNIAYSALSALCTKNPKTRVQMGSYRFMFAIGAVLVMSFLTMNLVETFGGGQQGWRTVSIIYAVACLALLMIPVLAVRELSPEQLQEESANYSAAEKEELSFWKGFVLLLKNKYFLLILVLYLTMYFSSGVTGGLAVYFATYQLGSGDLLGIINMAGMLPIVILLPFVAKLTEKFGIKNATLYGRIIGLAGTVISLVGGLLANFTLVMAGLVIAAVGTVPQTGALNALIAEADEYSYLKYGHRLTGTIFACSSVGIKVGTGLGTAATGFLLDLSGFDGTVAVQSQQALNAINMGYLLPPVIAAVLAVVIFFFMNVEEENQKLRQAVHK